MTHADLIKLACAWLRKGAKPKCHIVLGDFRCNTVSEHPDAIGWSTYGSSILIECKTSRSDFLADAKKVSRRFGYPYAMGDERYFLAPAGMLRPEDLPPGWGLLEPLGSGVRVFAKSTRFERDPLGVRHELALLATAVRRAMGDGVSEKYEEMRAVRGFVRLLRLAGAGPAPAPRVSHRLTHGHTRGRKPTREFNAWVAMRARCENPRTDRYARYGGRGISACDRWRSFENFLADMGPCPPGMSIERKDKDGNYEPTNCIWATTIEQANNRSNNRVIEHGGETRTLADWARHIGIDYGRLQSRLDRGWPPHLALDPKARRRDFNLWKGTAKARTSFAHEAACGRCGAAFVAKSSRSRWCSAKCRKRAAGDTHYAHNKDRINAARRATHERKNAQLIAAPGA